MDAEGIPLLSKCYNHECKLDSISSEKAQNLFKTLKAIQENNSLSKVKSIFFEHSKLLIEYRSKIIVFYELDLKDNDEEYRKTIGKLADQMNKDAKAPTKTQTQQKLSLILDTDILRDL